MREPCFIVADILHKVKSIIAPDITTADIERFVMQKIIEHKAVAAFKGYKGFPSCVCTSVNDEVIHGIPSKKKRLKNGDIIGIDLGIFKNGFYGDAAITVAVGTPSPEALRLMKVTEECLYIGISKAVVGNRVSDISSAIQQHAEANGYNVVRSYIGHGIGRHLHEEPQVPNYGPPGRGARLKEGMTLAIEPMVNMGVSDVKVKSDGWTAVTADGKLSAHFEHTVLITNDGPEILTKI